MLHSLTKVETPVRADWEVIVVNNRCTDDTDRVVGHYRPLLPLTRVFEPRPGLSHARNTGMASASGDYLLWTDDDVTVRPNWLRAYEVAFETWPDASIFGGPVIPSFEGHPPDWIPAASHHFPGVFAGIDLGQSPFKLDSSSNAVPFGANMAIRRKEQCQFPYDPRLGRRPGPFIIGGEEFVVLKNILTTGHSGWWIPESVVEHWIPPSRQTTQYLYAYFQGMGQVHSTSLVQPMPAFNGHTRARLYVKAVLLESVFRYYRHVSPPDKWLPALRSSALAWGRLMGLNPQTHSPSPEGNGKENHA